MKTLQRDSMKPARRRRRWVRLYTSRKARMLGTAMAAFPLCQTTGCFPDPIGALSFELQSLINTVLINTVAIVVQNLLGL
ncbi:MAG TPA: hypothetical protein VNT79_00650 [Phycisphaerae bacterium]|nr:hypothetical protein [Phycisphaerae bacterium]